MDKKKKEVDILLSVLFSLSIFILFMNSAFAACEVSQDSLVNLDLTVTDVSAGDIMDVTLSVSGKDVPVKNTVPIDVMLVIDTSGSMADNSKLTNAKASAKSFVNSILTRNPGSRIGLISFSHSATIKQALTSDGNTLKSKIDALSATGGTNYYNSIWMAADTLSSSTGANPKIIVFLTDGTPTVHRDSPKECSSNSFAKNPQANNGAGTCTNLCYSHNGISCVSSGSVQDPWDTQSALDASQHAAEKGVELFTIGFGNQADLDGGLLVDMARYTEHGAYYFSSSSESALTAIFENIATELDWIASQITIHFLAPSGFTVMESMLPAKAIFNPSTGEVTIPLGAVDELDTVHTTIKIRADTAGERTISPGSFATYLDATQSTRQLCFPEKSVTVHDPTIGASVDVVYVSGGENVQNERSTTDNTLITIDAAYNANTLNPSQVILSWDDIPGSSIPFSSCSFSGESLGIKHHSCSYNSGENTMDVKRYPFTVTLKYKESTLSSDNDYIDVVSNLAPEELCTDTGAQCTAICGPYFTDRYGGGPQEYTFACSASPGSYVLHLEDMGINSGWMTLNDPTANFVNPSPEYQPVPHNAIKPGHVSADVSLVGSNYIRTKAASTPDNYFKIYVSNAGCCGKMDFPVPEVTDVSIKDASGSDVTYITPNTAIPVTVAAVISDADANLNMLDVFADLSQLNTQTTSYSHLQGSCEEIISQIQPGYYICRWNVDVYLPLQTIAMLNFAGSDLSNNHFTHEEPYTFLVDAVPPTVTGMEFAGCGNYVNPAGENFLDVDLTDDVGFSQSKIYADLSSLGLLDKVQMDECLSHGGGAWTCELSFVLGTPSIWVQQDQVITKNIGGIEHEISLVDVTANGDSCGVSVDSTVMWIDEGRAETINGVKIKILEARPVDSDLQDQDLCKVQIFSVVDAGDAIRITPDSRSDDDVPLQGVKQITVQVDPNAPTIRDITFSTVDKIFDGLIETPTFDPGDDVTITVEVNEPESNIAAIADFSSFLNSVSDPSCSGDSIVTCVWTGQVKSVTGFEINDSFIGTAVAAFVFKDCSGNTADKLVNIMINKPEEPCPPGCLQDSDNDEICDESDNCPYFANVDQLDLDGDGVGYDCDLDEQQGRVDCVDLDQDYICDDADNCNPSTEEMCAEDPFMCFNPEQLEVPGTGKGWACTPEDDIPAPGCADLDSDLVCDDTDNCNPLVHCADNPLLCYNPDQLDIDGDGVGYDCDRCNSPLERPERKPSCAYVNYFAVIDDTSSSLTGEAVVPSYVDLNLIALSSGYQGLRLKYYYKVEGGTGDDDVDILLNSLQNCRLNINDVDFLDLFLTTPLPEDPSAQKGSPNRIDFQFNVQDKTILNKIPDEFNIICDYKISERINNELTCAEQETLIVPVKVLPSGIQVTTQFASLDNQISSKVVDKVVGIAKWRWIEDIESVYKTINSVCSAISAFGIIGEVGVYLKVVGKTLEFVQIPLLQSVGKGLFKGGDYLVALTNDIDNLIYDTEIPGEFGKVSSMVAKFATQPVGALREKEKGGLSLRKVCSWVTCSDTALSQAAFMEKSAAIPQNDIQSRITQKEKELLDKRNEEKKISVDIDLIEANGLESVPDYEGGDKEIVLKSLAERVKSLKTEISDMENELRTLNNLKRLKENSGGGEGLTEEEKMQLRAETPSDIERYDINDEDLYLGNNQNMMDYTTELQRQQMKKTADEWKDYQNSGLMSSQSGFGGSVFGDKISTMWNKMTDTSGTFLDYGDVSFYVAASADPWRSLIVASIPPTTCIPAIIYHINNYRQIQCRYVNCYFEQASSYSDVSVCESERGFEMCKGIIGEAVEFIGLFRFARGFGLMVQNLFANLPYSIAKGGYRYLCENIGGRDRTKAVDAVGNSPASLGHIIFCDVPKMYELSRDMYNRLIQWWQYNLYNFEAGENATFQYFGLKKSTKEEQSECDKMFDLVKDNKIQTGYTWEEFLLLR